MAYPKNGFGMGVERNERPAARHLFTIKIVPKVEAAFPERTIVHWKAAVELAIEREATIWNQHSSGASGILEWAALRL
jgi:hypothetical protein